MDLEGVETEPDILDDGKKGPWTIFTNADCSEQFKNKHGENITLTFMGHPLEFSRSPTATHPFQQEWLFERACKLSGYLERPLADSTTHIVIKIHDKNIAKRINLSHISKACALARLRMCLKATAKNARSTPPMASSPLPAKTMSGTST